MDSVFFRKQSMKRVTSPEQLNDYLRVSSPKAWILLISVLLLIVGFLIWSAFTAVESYETGTASAEKGVLAITFEDASAAQHVQMGMTVQVGGIQAEVTSVGIGADGQIVAGAQASIPDGVYEVRVGYRSTQILSLLFN